MNRRGQKLLTQLAALVLVLLLVPVLTLVGFAAETETVEPVCYEHGDVNGDTVVDSRDAVYTLYHSVWASVDATKYPVSQDCDFNADGALDSKDAVWLLYASLGIVDGYELKGTIHAYYDPEWNWDENYGAKLIVRCGCGNGSEEVNAEVVHNHQDASCTEAGWDTYTATAEYDGKAVTDTKTVTIAATGHVMGQRTCTEGAVCENGCGHTLPALGHSYQVDSDKSTAATCTTDAVKVHVCQTCGDEKTVAEYGTATGHTYGEGEVVVNGCESHTVYTCACGHTITTDPVVSHVYTVKLTKEANCTNAGTRTYTCQTCGDTYDEVVDANGVHVWGEGVTTDGVNYTYTCSCCGTTKTAVVASTSAEVSKDTLKEAEVQLENASVKLDEATLEGIEDEAPITIEVDEVNVADLNLNTEELPGEIVNGKVYDFTMKQGDTEITEFEGSVTVSIPYTLQEGDDVDCIDVWYIDDNGNVDCYEGTYSNGQVTFTTNHFSYYTVTRLTTAERCAQYGHVEKIAHLDATCDTDGYDMVSCQRCGNVEKSVIKATGHSFTETKVDATCTADGSLTKTCACGHESTTVLPALGHAWGESVVVKATCTENGSETRTCGTCGETDTAVLLAQGHSYDVTEVAATCTEAGTVTYTCSACGDTYTEAGAGALGHDYQAAEENWVWAEDYSKATVTLVCSHDSSHTKELQAAVTKTSEDCYGHVAYTATASFNKVTYTSVKELNTGMESHTPNGEWVGLIDHHYQYCVRCDLILDAAGHNLGEQTAITEPTCVNSGSAVATCTVCGYEVNIVLPATGIHSYVNGVCIVCGAEDTSCKHLKLARRELDLSAYDVCEGSYWINSCECGKKSNISINSHCNFVDVAVRDVTTPDGIAYRIWTQECQECGLTYEYAFYEEVDKQTCDSYMVDWSCLSLNGVTIAETRNYMPVFKHMMNYRYEEVDLSEYGICGEVLIRGYCYCGQQVYTFSEYHGNACDWEQNSDGEYVDVYTCTVCGTVKTVSGRHEFDRTNCVDSYIQTVTFERNGKTVYTYTDREGLEVHSYELTSYEMEGETCEDGVFVVRTCTTCGAVDEYYTDYHPAVIRTVTDLSSYGFCVDSFVQEVCPCGVEKYSYIQGLNNCEMEIVSQDTETNTTIYKCAICGLTRTQVITNGEKDENCNYIRVTSHVYEDADGNTVVEGVNQTSYVQHNWKHTATLLEGSETCEDGARIDVVCTDCGSHHFYTTHYHETVEVEAYELSELGLCGGRLVHDSCACGQNSHGGVQESQCSWEYCDSYDEGGTHHYIEKCSGCGAFMEWQHIYTEIGLCKERQDSKVIVTLNEAVVAEMAYTSYIDVHRFVYDLTVLDGSCENGASVVARCVDCGFTENRGTTYDAHSVWAVDREMLSEGQLCADVEKVYFSCACGQEQRSETWWSSGGCDFDWENGFHDSETDSWVEQCSVCGAYYYQRHETEQIEGSCEVKRIGYYTYRDKDGNELFSYTENWSGYEHMQVCDIVMEGTTCEEGYYLSWTCAKCGESSTEPEYRTDCTIWLTGYEMLYDGEGICGQIVKKTEETPCGSNKDIYISTGCSFSWYGYNEELQAEIGRCDICGMERRRSTEGYYESEDSCAWNETVTETFILGDEVLATVQFVNVTNNHSTVAICEFTEGTSSCDEGYYLTETCTKCGEILVDHELRYGHERHRTEYYDLTDYGLCGGEIWRESCACGDYSNWYWNLEGCDWVYEGTDSETGLERRSCSVCNTVMYFANVGQVDRDICAFVGTFICQLFRDDEQLLNINGDLRWESHDTYAESFTLNGETCEDGYIVHEKCLYCDYTCDIRHGGNDHSHHRVRVIDLTAEEYGLCGGNLTQYRCACGAESTWSWNFDACDWTLVSGGDDGLEHFYCGVCGTYRDFAYSSVMDRLTCTTQTTMIVKLTRDDVTLLDLNEVNTGEAHSYEATFEGTCTDERFKVIHTCVYCGKSQEGWASGHNTYVVKRVIDLSAVEGPCGTSIAHVSCPCGESSWVNLDISCANMSGKSWEETGTDGYTHEYYEASCQECGFKYVRDRYYVTDTVNCLQTRYDAYSFYNGEELIYTCNTRETYNAHSYGDPVLTLMEGAVTCEDGVYVTRTCKVCDYTTTDTHHNHATTPVERIDLRQYGATCATEMVRYACACGENQAAQLEGEEMCDMEWVYNDEKYYSQYNTNGYVGFYDRYHVVTCAVSEPEECGFKIYHANIWEPLEEDPCVYERCQFWLLGFNEETGEYQAEVVVKSGEKQLYHNYSSETVTEEQEDGTTVTTETYTCLDCGSTYVEAHRWSASGELVSRIRHAVSTLNNGFDKEWYQEEVFGLEQNNVSLETRTYTRQVHADGTEYWSQSEYVYDFENGACQRTVTHTDSYGSNETWSDEHFRGWSGNGTEWTREPSCTQFGEGIQFWTCVLCGMEREEAVETDPYAHNWYNREDGTYGCEYCGMISEVDASGSIVLEDLSDYKSGDTYVAGYWNRGGVEFTTYVCVYLVDAAEGENDEILLEGIETTMLTLENDGMTAISFSWSGADAAADAAVAAAGYEGEYYVRLVFVPVNGEDTLDYAVTFVPKEY